jgi:tetratricopeptide (TPR) repeat protein
MKRHIYLIVVFLTISAGINAQCYYGQPTYWWAKSKTTGLPTLDNILNTENILLQAIFNVNIDLYVGGEQINEKNAMFAPKCGYQNCEGEIWLGLNLMSSLFKKPQGLERLKAVFAHEYAHALQYKLGFAGYGKYPELHADYLAGYYIGVKGGVSADLLQAFVNEFYSMGDPYFFSPDHHGTGTERGCAFIEGYKIATEYHYNIYQAYYAGIDYVRANTPCASFKTAKQYDAAPVNNKITEKGTLVIMSEKKKLVLVDMFGRVIGHSSPGRPYYNNNLQSGTYYITPWFNGLLGGGYRLPTLTVEIKGYTKTTALISNVKNFFVLDYDLTLWNDNLPRPEDYYKSGYEAYKANNYTLAQHKFDKQIDSIPQDYNARFLRAICKSNLGDRNGAIQDYMVILENQNEILNPTFLLGTVYNNIGYCYLELKDYTKAEVYIKRALELNPYEYYIWGSSGKLNYCKGNYNKTIADMNKALELINSRASKASSSENVGFYYYYRGLAYLNLKKKTLACNDFTKAKELGYDDASVQIQKNCQAK